jgi:hypothetical protein
MRRRSRRLRALIRSYMSKALSLFDYLQNCRRVASAKDRRQEDRAPAHSARSSNQT